MSVGRPLAVAFVACASLLGSASPSRAANETAAAVRDSAARVAVGIAQLRHALGSWDTTTEYLRPDGGIALSVQGTYTFEWVVPDRVLAGRSEIPKLKQVSGILFYVRPDAGIIEMSSVGRDGQLWVMTGRIDGEVRGTPDTQMPDGSTIRLRFTRDAVTPDRFESRMEYSSDAGGTWTPGNHQVFTRRQTAAAPAATPDSSKH